MEVQLVDSLLESGDDGVHVDSGVPEAHLVSSFHDVG